MVYNRAPPYTLRVYSPYGGGSVPYYPPPPPPGGEGGIIYYILLILLLLLCLIVSPLRFIFIYPLPRLFGPSVVLRRCPLLSPSCSTRSRAHLPRQTLSSSSCPTLRQPPGSSFRLPPQKQNLTNSTPDLHTCYKPIAGLLIGLISFVL